MKIVGIDILPDRNSFALALLEGDDVEVRIVPMRDLLRHLEAIDPDIIAIDDESEYSNGMLQRLSELGASVVKAGRRGEKIYESARNARLWSGGHPSPTQTAILNAKLTSLGIYEEIYPGIRETIVRISPERASYRGGREDKYRRSLKVFLEHMKEDIEKRLKANKIEYDLFSRGSGYEFRIYEKLSSVRKLLRDIEHSDVRIEIYSGRSYKRGGRGKYIIGIDPGYHVGLAFLDIYGRLIHSATLEGGRESVIAYIRSIGDPLLIAVDVPEVPTFIRRVAASLKAPIYVPNRYITLEEKRQIASEYSLKGSAHERDALSAAVKAYYKYKQKIDRAIRLSREHNIDPEEVVYMIMRNVPVAEAISSLLPKPKPKKEAKPKRTRTLEDAEREIESLRESLERLKLLYASLEEKYNELLISIEASKVERESEILRDTMMKSLMKKKEALELEASALREKNHRLESIIERISKRSTKILSGWIIAKSIRNLTRKSLEEISPMTIEEGDIVIIRGLKSDPKAKKEILSKASMIIVPKSILKEARRRIDKRVLPLEELEYEENMPVAIIYKPSLDEAIKRLEEEEQKMLEKTFKEIISELTRR